MWLHRLDEFPACRWTRRLLQPAHVIELPPRGEQCSFQAHVHIRRYMAGMSASDVTESAGMGLVLQVLEELHGLELPQFDVIVGGLGYA